MAALGKAGLKALEALRSRLAPARVPGIQFTREVPTPRPPATPFRERPEPPVARVRDFDSPREVVIPRVTDEIDPVTGRQVIKDTKHTINPVPREAFDEFDELFRSNRQATILELFSEIENVESIDRLYLVTELMRRYRPQMSPQQARVLEQSLEEAAQRIGIPAQIGNMRMFTYMVPDETSVASMGRTYGGGKDLLDEVNSIGGRIRKLDKNPNANVDPVEIVATMNKYDRGPDGGILGRAIVRGEAGDAGDQLLIQNQINYWRRRALEKAKLEPEDFNGLRGLRYSDDMSEAEMFKRTSAALRSATSEDEIAMILVQSRGKVKSLEYTDVLDDIAGRMTLDLSGGIPFDAELSSLGRHVPGSPYFLGTMEDITNVDDLFVRNPFIGPLMQSPLGARTVQGMLRKMGGGEIPESLLRTPGPRASRTRGANIEPRKPIPSPFEELGSATSGPTGYGPVFRRPEPEFVPLSARGLHDVVVPRTIEFQNAFIETGVRVTLPGTGRIPKQMLDKGTDVQQRWANRFANERIDQLTSSDIAVRREAMEAMRDAVDQGWVEPGLLAAMRRIAKQGTSAPSKPRTGPRRRPEMEYVDITTGLPVSESTPATSWAAVRGRPKGASTQQPTTQAPAASTPATSPAEITFISHMKMPMNFADGTRGLRMAPQHAGKSTMDLILEGKRTGTTRASLGQFKKPDGSTLQVGDLVEFTDNAGRKALVEITKAPYQLPRSSDPAQMDWYARTWSKYEGWDPSMYSKFADQWQIQYELLFNL